MLIFLFSLIVAVPAAVPYQAEAAPAVVEGTTAEVVRKGPHFELVCHFANEAAADQALAAAEAAWPSAAKLYKLPKEFDGELLRVHLYRNVDDYVVAEQELTQGKFKRNLAFAHYGTRSAHVALWPPLSDEALARVGLPAQTQRLLAHEAAHLIRYEHFPNHSSHPGWFADGAASWIDEQASDSLGVLDEIESDPGYSTNVLLVQRLLERDALPTVEQILLDQTGSLEFNERYDVRWLFFRFLHEGKHAKRFAKVAERVRQIGGGDDFASRLRGEFEEVFGKSRYGKLDKEFHKYIEGFEPQWEEIFRALYFQDGVGYQAASDKNAIAWRREPAGEKYVVAGELTVLPGPNVQMNVLLGRSDQGFVCVALSGGGGVTIFEYLSATRDWQRRGYVDCSDIKVGEEFSFQVSVEGNEVQVKVNGKQVIQAEAQTVSLEGPWGLGALANSAGIWKITSPH